MPTLEAIRQSSPEQWLAVEVTETDSNSREPVAGRVLTHATTREDIWARVRQWKDRDIFVFYNGPPLPEGYAAAF